MLFRIFEINEETRWNKWLHEIEADSEADALAAIAAGDTDGGSLVGEYGDGDFGRSVYFVQPIASEDAADDPAGYEKATAQLREPTRIIVNVSGGVVQGVENCPPGVVIEVRDYDVSPTHTPEELAACPRDASGDPYEVLEF